MSEKLLEIHGFLSQQGGILGATEDFKYFEIDIPELHFPSVDVAGVSLDILVTVLIAKSSVPANIGKQATRRIKAVAIRAASRVITVNKTVEGIIVDTEMELAQTNLLVYKNRLFLAVTGTSSGDLFSCSASVRYLATGEHEVQKHRKPIEQVVSGTIIEYPNSPLDVDHNSLDGRSSVSCHPGTSIDYDNTSSGLVADDVQGAIDEVEDRVDSVESITNTVTNILNATGEPTGFENRTTSTLTYNAGRRELTINHVGTCYYWIKGVRYTLTGPLTSAPHADTSGVYFFYFNSANVLTSSHDFWDLSAVCPIAFVLYDTIPVPAQGVLCDERHGMVMDWATHVHQHFAKGAFVQSGFALDDTSYVIGSIVKDEKRFRIENGYFCDEDITLFHDDSLIMEILANRKYALFYRTGVNGDWTWSKDEVFPVLWDSATTFNPYYNQYVGGAWQLTLVSTKVRWFNVFTCVTNSHDPYYKVINIVGQVLHTSLAAAEEENILSLEWGDVPFQEIAPIYQTSFRCGPYGEGGNPNVRIDAIQKIIGISITLSGLLASNHASLAGRDLPNSHPASAISYDNTAATGDLSSTDVQNAIEEIGDLMNRGPQAGTITRALGEVTRVDYVRTFGTTVVEITRVGGVVTTVKTSYDDGVNPKIVRTKTLTYDIDGNLISWVTV